jgi:hypothetical protein
MARRMRAAAIVTWLAIFLGLVAVVPVTAWWMQDRLVFFPQPLAGTAMPADAEPLEVRSADGPRLRGWIRVGASSPAPVLVYFGGNAEEVSWALADRRWPPGWSVAALNYRGYGASEGVPGEAALRADALALYDALRRRPDVDTRRIVVFGRSLGTGVAVSLAAERPVGAVVLASPYDSLVAVGRTHYPWLPVSLALRHRFDSATAASSIRSPLLVIVAERDAVVPAERSRALYEAWAGPKRWVGVPGTDHNTLAAPDAFWRAIGDFLTAPPT